MASKSSKPLPPLGPGRRAQPMRSSKASAPWTNEASELARSDTYAITFFADAITALPRELVRHFTLLKEVDAKIFLPEAALEKEVEEALEAPLPQQSLPPISATRSGPASLNGSIANDHGSSIASPANQINSGPYTDDNWPRRQKFRSLSLKLQDMLVSLDEKNHVISTAVEALNKQMVRLDDCYPKINNEVSEEARYGNVKHWAYEENRIGRTSTEKTRREVAESSLTAAQQAAAEEIAARSETRKLAVQAKRGRNHHNESDFDDHNDSRKPEPTKKLHGNSKIRKAAEASSAVGLGITNGTPVNGNPPPKRRKVEKSNNHAAAGSLASAIATNGVAKGKAGSPRDTPMPETKRKAKAAPTTNGSHSRKRNNTVTSVAHSPSLQSSPVHGTFAEAKLSRVSPAPTNGRPASSRARQNSTHSILDGTRQRPGSSASNKVNGNSKVTAEPSNAATEQDQTVLPSKASVKDLDITEPNTEDPKEEVPIADPVEPKKDDPPPEDIESKINGDSMQDVVMTNAVIAPPIAATRNGRNSKPSTPAIPSFPENVSGNRSGRSSRNQHEHPNTSAANSTTSSGSGKRSHKKGAGAAAAAAAAAMQQQAEKEKERERSEHEQEGPTEQTEQDAPMEDVHEEEKVAVDNDETLEGDTTEIAAEEEVDEDEPRYCYCNGVSYGEMVGCDADGCVREWFHLGCVGLKVAPKGNAKWYCDDCKEKVKNSKRGRSSG